MTIWAISVSIISTSVNIPADAPLKVSRVVLRRMPVDTECVGEAGRPGASCGFPSGIRGNWILCYFCRDLAFKDLPPVAGAPQTPAHKIRFSSFPNLSGPKLWLYSTSPRRPSLKSFYGAVLELQASAQALLSGPKKPGGGNLSSPNLPWSLVSSQAVLQH